MPDYDFYDMETQGMEVLREGEEVEIHVRDRETMESKAVKAMVSANPDKLAGANKLYVYGRLGVPLPSPWYIKIIEELGEEALGTAAEVADVLESRVKSAEAFRKPKRIV